MTDEHRRNREVILSRIEAHPGISNQELSAILGWTINRVTPRTVTLTDECNDPDRGPAPLLDYPGYGEGTEIYSRWTVKEIIEQAVSRSFLLRIWDGEPPEGQINIHVPRNTAELARQYIAISLLYGDLYRKAEALAHEIGEGTDTKEKLKEIIDKHNRRMEGRE